MINFRTFMESAGIRELRQICSHWFQKVDSVRKGHEFQKDYEEIMRIIADAGNQKKARLIEAIFQSGPSERNNWLRHAEHDCIDHNFYGWYQSNARPYLMFIAKANDFGKAIKSHILEIHERKRIFGIYDPKLDENDDINLTLSFKFKDDVVESARKRFMGVEQYLDDNNLILHGDQLDFEYGVLVGYSVKYPESNKNRVWGSMGGRDDLYVIQDILKERMYNLIKSGKYNILKYKTVTGSNIVQMDLEVHSVIEHLIDKFNPEVL